MRLVTRRLVARAHAGVGRTVGARLSVLIEVPVAWRIHARLPEMLWVVAGMVRYLDAYFGSKSRSRAFLRMGGSSRDARGGGLQGGVPVAL